LLQTTNHILIDNNVELIIESLPGMLHRGSSPPLSKVQPSYLQALRNEETSLPPSYRASVENKSSLGLPQRLERKLAEYDASQNIFKRWLFEIISLTLSAACMVSILSNTTKGPCDNFTLLGHRHRDLSPLERPASQQMASCYVYQQRAVQDRICRSHTSNFGIHWTIEMGLVPW
jgi:hypothetical protein